MEAMIYRLARGPATWAELMDASGAAHVRARTMASRFLRQLVRTGVVKEPAKAGQPYKLAPLDNP